jgi:uncharacterized protein with PIN domain
MKKNKITFLCDRMLGKLCRMLRLLGFDAELVPDGETGRFLVLAEQEGRVAVTRARRHADRPGRAPVVIRSEETIDQIVELLSQLEELQSLELFTRCLECNELLEEAPPEAVKGEVPEFVGKTFTAFRRCPTCRRIYWEGTHFQAMRAKIDEIERRLKDTGTGK